MGGASCGSAAVLSVDETTEWLRSWLTPTFIDPFQEAKILLEAVFPVCDDSIVMVLMHGLLFCIEPPKTSKTEADRPKPKVHMWGVGGEMCRGTGIITVKLEKIGKYRISNGSIIKEYWFKIKAKIKFLKIYCYNCSPWHFIIFARVIIDMHWKYFQ